MKAHSLLNNAGPCNRTMLGLAWELDPIVRPNCYYSNGGPHKALPGWTSFGYVVAQLSNPL